MRDTIGDFKKEVKSIFQEESLQKEEYPKYIAEHKKLGVKDITQLIDLGFLKKDNNTKSGFKITDEGNNWSKMNKANMKLISTLHESKGLEYWLNYFKYMSIYESEVSKERVICTDLSKEKRDELKNKILLSECFSIDNSLVPILLLTNNEVFLRQLPYDCFSIDVILRIDDLIFNGFYIDKDNMFYTFSHTIDYSVLEGSFWQGKLFPDSNDNDKDKKVLDKLRVFICNFLDFLNNPEVIIDHRFVNERQIKKRISRGEESIYYSNNIRLTGTLRKYVYNFSQEYSKNGNHLGHRFWIRGHFRRFWKQERYVKLYKLLLENRLPINYSVDIKSKSGEKIIMYWQKPFIKGKGILVNKKYEVKK